MLPFNVLKATQLNKSQNISELEDKNVLHAQKKQKNPALLTFSIATYALSATLTITGQGPGPAWSA